MKHRIPATLVVLAALLDGDACWAQSGAAPAGLPATDSPKAAIHLDGRLDEDLWKSPVLFAELVQQSPRPGEPTPFKTYVRVLVVGNTVYFGFECTDPEPDRIAVHNMRRDGEVEGDDTVSVVLDTFADKRTGYLFKINAAGARIDGLISNPERVSLDWDGLWDARTARGPAGWSAELEIPAATLNFTPGLKAWGMNVERFIARERMKLRWKSPTLDSFLFDLSRAGDLPGVEHLAQGRGLEFTPYLTGRNRVVFGETDRVWDGDAGGEVTWRITPGLQSVATFNTDFAETEVDSRQINVTRFPLFFPEKRAFFLEGSNQFTFGLGLGEQFIPFFSRRVGLLEGEQIPINAGFKMNGRVGNWNVGLLDVQTRDVAAAPSANLFAGRVSYDVTKALRLGAIVTNGDPHGLRTNTLSGADAVWQTSKFLGDKNFMVGGWSAISTGDLQPGRRTGWGFKIDYPNDLWDCSTSINSFGDALDPALGFLPRPGTRQYVVGCDWMPRPSKNGPLRFIRQEFFENRYTRTTNLNGVNESWRYFMAPVNVQFESGDRFEFNWTPQYEFLQEPFEIVDGVKVSPGPYHFTRWRLEAETSRHRPVQFETTTWFGTFYGGHLTQWENSLSWTSPEGRLQLGLAAEQNFGHLPEGNFVQRLWQLQTAAALSPNLVLTSFIQYDSESKNLGSNTRLRWTIRPGRELFVIWNRGWRRLITSRDELNLVPDEELIAVKLKWTFRM